MAPYIPECCLLLYTHCYHKLLYLCLFCYMGVLLATTCPLQSNRNEAVTFIFLPHETRQANKQTVCSMVLCDLARSHHMNTITHRVHVF